GELAAVHHQVLEHQEHGDGEQNSHDRPHLPAGLLRIVAPEGALQVGIRKPEPPQLALLTDLDRPLIGDGGHGQPCGVMLPVAIPADGASAGGSPMVKRSTPMEGSSDKTRSRPWVDRGPPARAARTAGERPRIAGWTHVDDRTRAQAASADSAVVRDA